MVHYKPVQTTITAPALAEVILNVVVRHHGLLDSIVSDRGSVFTSKFWSSLCYFLSIKRRLSTAFYPQTDGQTERQNSTMEAYLRAFVNYEQDNWVRLLPMAEFAYNNAKHASTGYTLFELNCTYHPRVSTKRTSTPASGLKQLISWPKNLGILWLHAERTYNTPNNCKNKPMIKELSLEVTLLAKKFGWTANISKSNTIGS